MNKIVYYCRWVLGPGLDENVMIIGLPVLCISLVVLTGILTIKVKNNCTYSLRKLSCTFTPAFVLGILSFHQSPSMETHILYKVTTGVLIGSLVLYIMAISASNHADHCAIIRITELSALAGLSLSVIVAEDHFNIGYLCSVGYVGLLLVGFHRKTIMPVITIPLYVLLNYKVILQEISAMNVLNIVILLVLILSQAFICIFKTTNITTIDCWQVMYGKNITQCVHLYDFPCTPDGHT